MSRQECDIAKVQESCVIIIYDHPSTGITKGPRKVYLVPKGINLKTAKFP
jgi:hypothetical protein